MKLGSTGYESHPAADLFPMMGEAELAALADDIERNGLHQPIVLLDGQVLDGRNRLLACERTTRDPRFERWAGAGSPTAWVLSQNLHRRHLTEAQRAMIAARAKESFEAEARERQAEGGRAKGSANLREASKSSEQAAALVNVSPRSVESAAKVLKRGVPELAAAVERGDVAVSAAAAVASEPADVQRKLVAAGPQAIREAAKEKRAASKLTAEERRHVESLLKNAAPPSDGMAFAFMAIEQLKQIREDDSERSKAFAHVHQWLRDHEN